MKSNNVLPELSWKTKLNQTGTRSSDDVSIAITKSKGEAKRLSLIFRIHMWEVLSSEYIAFAVLKNRIYFKGTDKKEGYTVSVKNTSGYLSITLNQKELETYEDFVGDYSLKFDNFYELYYIEREN